MRAQALESRPTATVNLIGVQMRRRDDAVHTELIERYGAYGGVASPDEVISLMRPYWRQPISILARWIFGRKVVSFTWRMQMQLPIFQFVRPRMTPASVIADCSLELGEFMDEERFALWFVRPCTWLDQKMPVDVLPNDPHAVVEAASRTRFALMAHRPADAATHMSWKLRSVQD